MAFWLLRCLADCFSLRLLVAVTVSRRIRLGLVYSPVWVLLLLVQAAAGRFLFVGLLFAPSRFLPALCLSYLLSVGRCVFDPASGRFLPAFVLPWWLFSPCSFDAVLLFSLAVRRAYASVWHFWCGLVMLFLPPGTSFRSGLVGVPDCFFGPPFRSTRPCSGHFSGGCLVLGATGPFSWCRCFGACSRPRAPGFAVGSFVCHGLVTALFSLLLRGVSD